MCDSTEPFLCYWSDSVLKYYVFYVYTAVFNSYAELYFSRLYTQVSSFTIVQQANNVISNKNIHYTHTRKRGLAYISQQSFTSSIQSAVHWYTQGC